jgi:hypothetical protein
MATRSPQSAIALGVLTVLAAAAAVLSIATAPPAAEQQVRVAAGATVGVGSFVMDLEDTVSSRAVGSAPPQVQSSQARVVYQSPDRIAISGAGGSGQVVLVGNLRYEQSPTGRWVRLSSVPGAAQSYAEGVVLVPAKAFTAAEDVTRATRTSSLYSVGSMQAAELDTLLGVYFRVPESVIRSHFFVAQIHKEYMTAQQLTAAAGNQVDTFTIHYSELGTAPAVVIPSISPGP